MSPFWALRWACLRRNSFSHSWSSTFDSFHSSAFKKHETATECALWLSECLRNKNEHISFMSFSWKCFMLWMASLYRVIRKIETTFLCFKFSVILCTKHSRTRSRDKRNTKQRLTVYYESPFVFYCTIWYEWILRATRQVFAVVIHHGNERQNAQWLIACLGELWNKWKMILKLGPTSDCFCTSRRN